MNIFGHSDIGRVRTVNEDSFLIHKFDESSALIIIADGMGGHNCGEVASQMAVDIIFKSFKQNYKKIYDDASEALRQAIILANGVIYSEALNNKEQMGMGTTVIAAFYDKKTLHIAHVGDSRAYIINKKNIKQLTQDHSIVFELTKKGSITKEQAKNHPQKNIITRAVGTDISIECDIITEKIKKSDTALFCTDGLINKVSEVELIDINLENISLEQKVLKMIELANKKDGTDNVTVIGFMP